MSIELIWSNRIANISEVLAKSESLSENIDMASYLDELSNLHPN